METSEESHRLLDRPNAEPEDQSQDAESAKRPWLEHTKGVLAAFSFSISHIFGATSVQLLDRRVPDFELQVFRSVAIVLFCLL